MLILHHEINNYWNNFMIFDDFLHFNNVSHIPCSQAFKRREFNMTIQVFNPTDWQERQIRPILVKASWFPGICRTRFVGICRDGSSGPLSASALRRRLGDGAAGGAWFLGPGPRPWDLVPSSVILGNVQEIIWFDMILWFYMFLYDFHMICILCLYDFIWYLYDCMWFSYDLYMKIK